ncbi:MAG: Mfa1 family fimbria major subunit, partial [Bacteroides sp.]
NTVETTAIAETNTETNPVYISVNVERIAAKIVFTTGTGTDINTYNVGSADNGISVAFDAFKIINTRNSAFNFRRVGEGNNATGGTTTTIGGAENANYVIENQWALKFNYSSSSATDFWTSAESNSYSKVYSRKFNEYVPFRKLENSKANAAQTLAYCLENTMPADKQLNGFTTGIIFRGKVTITAEGKQSTNGDFYRYGDTYYATLAALAKAHAELNLPTDQADLANISTNQPELAKYGIEYFKGGYCYYKYWIKHRPGDSDPMSAMTFAIVRNNVYKLTIQDVAGIGSSTSGTPGKPADWTDDPDASNPETPGDIADNQEEETTAPVTPPYPIDPDDPDADPTGTAYLKVGIRVLKWTVRTNEIHL